MAAEWLRFRLNRLRLGRAAEHTKVETFSRHACDVGVSSDVFSPHLTTILRLILVDDGLGVMNRAVYRAIFQQMPISGIDCVDQVAKRRAKFLFDGGHGFTFGFLPRKRKTPISAASRPSNIHSRLWLAVCLAENRTTLLSAIF